MLIGTLGVGESPTDQEANDALATLNEIVDKWNIESLMIISNVNIEVPLSGKKMYTIGPGGDINTLRPPSGILQAYYDMPAFNTVSMPLQIITEGQYDAITIKDLSVAIPNQVFYKSTYPLAELYIYPLSSNGKVVLNVQDQFLSFKTLDDIIDLPSGYVKALRYNLAVELSTEYGRLLDERIESLAVGAKKFIKVTNGAQRREILFVDSALRRGNKGKYNIYTGA